VLRTLQRYGGSLPLAALVDDLVVERTSLYRALTPLRRAGLVSIRSGADRRAREVALTSLAMECIAAAMPYWIAAQCSVLDRFGHGAWTTLAAQANAITAIARKAHA
jgi:DNA-binding MarR family transcriptional regulator